MGVRKNRRFRRNPYTASNPTVTDYGPQIGSGGDDNGFTFDSVTKARAFLKEAETLENAGALPSDLQTKIEAAEETIRKADLRNVRRQLKRYKKRGLTPPPELIDRYNALRAQAAFYPEPERYAEPVYSGPSRFDPEPSQPPRWQRRTALPRKPMQKPARRGLNGCTPLDQRVDNICNGDRMQPLRDISGDCLDILQERRRCITKHNQKKSSITRRGSTKKTVSHWEEVLGPDGETIRFMLSFDHNGHFAGRRPSKQSPQVGDVILDLTAGIKAWVMRKGRRRPTAVTNEMRRIYESSCLYKTRQLAAGQLDLTAYQNEVNNIRGASYK